MPDDFSPHDSISGGSQNSGVMVAVPARQPQLPAAWSHGPLATPEIINAKPGPVELLHALRRRWMVAVGLGLLVGGALAAMVWVLMPVRYEVAALLRVASSRPNILGATAGSGDADFATYKRTQAALLKSNFVLQATLRKPELRRLSLIQEHKDDAIDWLANQVTVDYPGDAEIMRVSMRGERPQELKTIVNAVKDSYMDEIVNAERMERLRQRDVLEKLYKKNRADIRDRSDALYRLHKEYSTASSETAVLKRNMAMRDLDTAVGHRNAIQQNIADLDMKILLIKARAEKGEEIKIPDFLFDQYISNDPQVAQLKQRLASIHDAIDEESHRVRRPNAPSLVRLQQHAQLIEEKIDERRNELRPFLMESFTHTNRGENSAEYLPLMEIERETLAAKLETLSQSVQEQLDALQKMQRYSAEIETRTAELAEIQQVTQKMGSELKLWAVELDARPRIQSIEEATVPSGNDAARKYAALAFAGIVGFAGVLFGVALLEFQSRRLNSDRDIREGLGIRVIGHLPSLSGRAWRRLADTSSKAGAHLQSLLTESVDSIRATLIHSNGSHPLQVVMVSSSDNQEGKTTVASQLAASLARAGRRTLLLDGDLRNPSAHVVFGLPLGPGFAEVLRGEAEREAAVYATPAPNLWLMPAGEFDASAVQAISGELLVSLIKSLKEQYDFVIVDAPPVLKVADPLILGQCVDAAVLSVRRDISRIPKVYEASERLRAVGVKVLGAIVNGVNEKPMKRSAPTHV